MPIARLSARGQLVIPSEVRKKLNLTRGSRLEIHVDDNKIVAYPIPEDPISACHGILKLGKSAIEIMKEVRKEERSFEELTERRKKRKK